MMAVATEPVAAGASTTSPTTSPTDPVAGSGSYLLTATTTGPTYEPTFTGNGELGIRVPPSGQGYAAGSVPTQAELAGFYAQPQGGVQQRANIPTWSTLTFTDGGQTFSVASGQTGRIGQTRGWRQTIDLRTGVIATTAKWTAPDGHVTDLTYQALTDRARPGVGLVELQLTPQWTGTASVDDVIDGSDATLTTQVAKGWSATSDSDWVTVKAQGTGIVASLASRLGTSADITGVPVPLDQSADQSVGQQLTFPVVAGRRYTVTKYVGVATAGSSGLPEPAAQWPARARAQAQAQADAAAEAGFGALLSANDAAWSALWMGRIDVLGDASLATDVNASEFYLWASTRDGVDWSISPAGLSSNGYNGHVFWDADTWMDPALLAQHPDLAAGIEVYRSNRLAAAKAHAAATGYLGARYPWESALDGTEQIPPPADVFTEGLYEQHITADVALAQWQYYLATGDRSWLSSSGWPVLSAAADFWASRVTAGPAGSFNINGVTGPDEDNPNVDDEAYTIAAARATLLDAAQAARVLGRPVPARWTQVAAGLTVPVDSTLGINPEFTGYSGQLVKQADVTMLGYPLDYPMTPAIAEGDVNYYAVRTNPSGPSMSDAVNAIDTLSDGAPGCAEYVYTERSVQPFIRDDFDQFSETASGGVLTFMTGIGGFLQEFLYGYTGLRFTATAVQVAPILTGQFDGVVVHGLAWHGRRFTVAVGPRATALTLDHGAALPISTPSGSRTVQPGQTLSIPTRRPDLAPTTDEVRCGAAVASSSKPGAPALAAVDGSPATDWQPVALPATLTVPLSGASRTVSTVTLRWGRQWPAAPLTAPPPPGPITTERASDYTVAVSSDGVHWHTVAAVKDRTTGTVDVLHFAATRGRFISLDITGAPAGTMPELDELTGSS
jgi:trehalose/maltose hydrolase-like predicted phosphorylase